MTKPITIYTFDGTASAGAAIPSNPGGQGVPSNSGGGYPAELADRLVRADPNVWSWYPVDYVPNRALGPDWRPVRLNVLDAYNGGTVSAGSPYVDRSSPSASPAPVASRVIPSVKAAILNTPGKFVLSGLSQGTIAVGYILNELRFGQLQSRFPDLLGVYNFGDAFRPSGWSVPLHGARDPGGAGALTLPWQQSYGNSNGLHNPAAAPALSRELYWSFSNLNDAASSVAASAQPTLGRIADHLMRSTTGSPNKLVLFYDRSGYPNGDGNPTGRPDMRGLVNDWPGLIPTLIGLAASAFTLTQLGSWLKLGEDEAKRLNRFAGQSMLRTLVDSVASSWRGVKPRPGQLLTIIGQWWPFGAGVLGITDDIALNSLNPHARYSRPWGYTALNNNDTLKRGAVQLAFDRLHAVGKNFYPHTTAAASPPASKPYWLLTFGKPGEYFDPATAAAAWPGLTALGQGAGSGLTGTTSLYGDLPVSVTADFGRRNTDPQQTGVGQQIFSGLPSATKAKVEWVPVSYNSAAFPSVVAARAAVDRAVALILASPAGTKFFLAGHGLGAVVSTLLWDEFATGGRLAARRANALGFYHYGNPVRPAGAFRSESNPGGRGVASVQAGVRLRPAAFGSSVWEFSAPGDPVSTQQVAASRTSKPTLLQAAFNVAWQNVPTASLLREMVVAQAREGASVVPVLDAKEQALALYSNAPGAHNSYQAFIPRPKASPGKSAIALAVDDITAKAV